MEARAAVLKPSFDIAHMVFNAVISDLDEAMAAYRVPGGNAPAAAPIIAHAVYSEDQMVNEAVRGGQTILSSAGLGARTGITAPGIVMTPEWLAMPLSLEALREYAGLVFAETSRFLESASGADLDRLVGTPLGTTVPAAECLAAFSLVHLSVHTGEISSAKGAQGARGLPF